jgi:hypothetical protein
LLLVAEADLKQPITVATGACPVRSWSIALSIVGTVLLLGTRALRTTWTDARTFPSAEGGHLETWFKHLGARIKDPGTFAAPPDVPDPVLQAAQHFLNAALA